MKNIYIHINADDFALQVVNQQSVTDLMHETIPKICVVISGVLAVFTVIEILRTIFCCQVIFFICILSTIFCTNLGLLQINLRLFGNL